MIQRIKPIHLRTTLFQGLWIIALGTLITATIFPAIPVITGQVYRDSGVFLYVGSKILEGEVPYRDVWDHKPPMIFFVNALGLLLSGGSRWGGIFLEWFCLLLAVYIAYRLIEQVFGRYGAMVGTLFWTFILPTYAPFDNLTEVYLVLPQVVSLSLFWYAERRGHYGWYGIAIGICGGIAFLLKQNLIGIWLVIGTYLLLRGVFNRRWREGLQSFATMILGAVAVLSVVAIYFAFHGALDELWDASFLYNFFYSFQDSGHSSNRVTLAWDAFQSLAGDVGSLFLISGLVFGAAYLRYEQNTSRKAFIVVCLFLLPVESVLASLSTRAYPHYYIPLLVPAALVAGLFCYVIQQSLVHFKRHKRHYLIVVPKTVLYAVLIYGAFLYVLSIRSMLRDNAQYERHIQSSVQYLEQHSESGDYVLMWGAETALNFLLNRPSPTRYVYQYPLYRVGYQSEAMVREFLEDLMANPPRIIVDTSVTNARIPPIASARRHGWLQAPPEGYSVLSDAMQSVFDYIETDYVRVGCAGEWDAYMHHDFAHMVHVRDESCPYSQ